MAYNINTLEQLQELATERNCELYTGADVVLLLDLDTPAQVLQYETMLPLVAEKFGAAEHLRWKSRGGGTHIVLLLGRSLAPPERIALQAALGSDPRREILAIFEFHVSGSDTISLFRPKEA
jgi:hypothetical protein